MGWQRALRLQPHAVDVRARLDAFDLSFPGTPAHVPPFGATPLVLGALACWIAAWGILAWRGRSPAVRRTLIAGAAAGALVLGGMAVVVDERLAADDLVVLRRGGGVSASPAIGARRDVRAETGEVGRAAAREGGWTFVRFDADRAGWVPASDLVSIARAPYRGG